MFVVLKFYVEGFEVVFIFVFEVEKLFILIWKECMFEFI